MRVACTFFYFLIVTSSFYDFRQCVTCLFNLKLVFHTVIVMTKKDSKTTVVNMIGFALSLITFANEIWNIFQWSQQLRCGKSSLDKYQHTYLLHDSQLDLATNFHSTFISYMLKTKFMLLSASVEINFDTSDQTLQILDMFT